MKWHSVLRRMPDDSRDVLTFCGSESSAYIVAYFCSATQCWIDRDSTVELSRTITHWMELPQPPEAKR